MSDVYVRLTNSVAELVDSGEMLVVLPAKSSRSDKG